MRGCNCLVRELNRFYRAQPALYEVDFDYTGFEWIDICGRGEVGDLVPAPRRGPCRLHRFRL